MPRRRTASARICKIMAAPIARPATIAAGYRELGATQTAAEIEKGL